MTTLQGLQHSFGFYKELEHWTTPQRNYLSHKRRPRLMSYEITVKRTHKVESVGKNATMNLALDTIKLDKQALVFVNSKRSAEKTAEDIALKVKKTTPKWNELSKKALNVLTRPTKQCRRLALCLKHGIAFHHAGLAGKQRELIEDAFRDTTIKIISCTPTLAAGVDLPAFRTIIRDLKRYSGSWGMTHIPVLEYKQMSGRAGRPGKETKGEAIIISATEVDKEEMHAQYILGEPEEITSKLAVEPVLRTYVLSLVASRFVDSTSRLHEFFSKTFWAHQYGDFEKLNQIIDKVVHLLEDYKFICTEKSEFVSADELGSDKIKATLLGKRVAELYIDPLTAHELMEGIRAMNAEHTEPFPLLHLVSSTLEMRPSLRVKTKEFDIIEEKLARYEDSLLKKVPSMYDPEYGHFLNQIKTALFMQDWVDESDEEELLEKYDIRPGEIRAKLNTADWLVYATEELARLMSFQRYSALLAKTRVRLKYGVREELLALLKLKNIGRVRARKLFNNNIKTLGDVRKIEMSSLSSLIGSRIAADIKEQLGEKVEKVPKGRRKGQLSLRKY